MILFSYASYVILDVYEFKVRMLYMTQTKIIFFDIDGTLIDMNRKKISEKMLETLIRLQEKGIKLCLANPTF